MADRVSTIRIKAVGMDEAANEVDSFSRKFDASSVRIDNAAKRVNKASIAGDADAMAKSNAQLERAMADRERILERAGVSDPMKGFEFREQDIQKTLADKLEKYKENDAAIVSAKRSAALEMQKIDQERGAYIARPIEEELKELERAEIEKERISNQSIIAQTKQYELEQELKERAIEEKLRADERYEAESERIGARAFSAAQKYIKANEAEAAESSGGGGGFNRFGGKMIIGMAAGRAAGDIFGDQHGGREIGSAVSGFMFGGPAIGGAVVALDLIGEAFRANRENAVAAEKSAKEYTKALEDLSDEWSGLATNLVKGDLVEESMRKVAKSGEGMAEKAQGILDAQGSGAQSFFQESLGNTLIEKFPALSSALGMKVGPTASESEAQAARKVEVAALASRREALQFEANETPKIAADRERILEAEERIAKARNGSEDYLKAEQALANTKSSSEYRQQMDIANAAVDASQKALDAAKLNGDLEAQVHAKQDLAEADKARNDLNDQWESKFTSQQLSDATEVSDYKIKRIQEEEHIALESAEKVGDGLKRIFGELFKISADKAKEAVTQQMSIQSKIDYYNEMATGGGQPGAQYAERVRDLMIGGKSRKEAEKTAGQEAELSKAQEHYEATQEIKKNASEAQYQLELQSAKTQADRQRAKHDYEVREETLAHPNRSKADIEAAVSAKDSLDEMKADRTARQGTATDRYQGVTGLTGGAKAFVDFRDMGLQGGRSTTAHRMTQRQQDDYHERWGSKVPLPKGFLGPTGGVGAGAVSMTMQTTKTPAELKLDSIDRTLKNIEAQGKIT
jgi:hypothetical protein